MENDKVYFSAGNKIYYVLGWENGTGIYHLDTDGKPMKVDMERDGNERLMRFSIVSQQLKWLQKEVLTVLEATMDDERKLNATKTLIKDKFSAKISWIYELCGTPEKEDKYLADEEDEG